jgi:tellurite resistance protein TerC
LAPGKRLLIKTYEQGRRVVRLVVGFTVLLVGVVLLVTPGPAFIVIPIGLAILATELVWARRLLNQLKNQAKKLDPRGTNPSRNSRDE